MLTLEKFTGINNVQPSERLLSNKEGTPLAEATNVDIGLSGEVRRRGGYTVPRATCHKNLWQGDGFKLATADGDLINADSRAVIYPALGVNRVWYMNLPDGRTSFSNGLINGITNGVARTGWGVPQPANVGNMSEVAGAMPPGDYQYQITYKRTVDGLEGGPAYSASPQTINAGGIMLTGLPVLAGYSINVYMTGQYGGEAFYVGNTTGSTFIRTTNDPLALPCRTEWLYPAPVGTVSAFWRGRTLVAVGSALWASVAMRWELFDLRRDFKNFTAPITLIEPVDGGIFVGTTDELCFLAGTEFDKLVYTPKVSGRTVLGSGVQVRGELLKQGEGAALGRAMVCIADSVVVAGFSDGGVVRVTQDRYKTTATEVAATFRMQDGIPQYIAIPQ